jgi:hypothetical protein
MSPRVAKFTVVVEPPGLADLSATLATVHGRDPAAIRNLGELPALLRRWAGDSHTTPERRARLEAAIDYLERCITKTEISGVWEVSQVLLEATRVALSATPQTDQGAARAGNRKASPMAFSGEADFLTHLSGLVQRAVGDDEPLIRIFCDGSDLALRRSTFPKSVRDFLAIDKWSEEVAAIEVPGARREKWIATIKELREHWCRGEIGAVIRCTDGLRGLAKGDGKKSPWVDRYRALDGALTAFLIDLQLGIALNLSAGLELSKAEQRLFLDVLNVSMMLRASKVDSRVVGLALSSSEGLRGEYAARGRASSVRERIELLIGLESLLGIADSILQKPKSAGAESAE